MRTPLVTFIVRNHTLFGGNDRKLQSRVALEIASMGRPAISIIMGLILCVFLPILLTLTSSAFVTPQPDFTRDTSELSLQPALPIRAETTPFLYAPFRIVNNQPDYMDTMTAVFDHSNPNYTRADNMIIMFNAGYFNDDCYSIDYNRKFVPNCAGPIQSFLDLEDEYGQRVYYNGHNGYDWGVRGDVLAAASGKIEFVGWTTWPVLKCLGYLIIIDHENDYRTIYGHMKSGSSPYHQGDRVTVGQKIGEVGNTTACGTSTGEHLHFQVEHWQWQNEQWYVTDPFGWGAIGREDPLVYFNGEWSQNLWVGYAPSPYGGPTGAPPAVPANSRYMGGAYIIDAPPSSDTILPGGYFVSPADGSNVGRYVQIAVSAFDNPGGSGVKEVRFSAKWEGLWRPLPVVSSPPYSIAWDTCAYNVPINSQIELGMEVWDNARNKYIWSENGGDNPVVTRNSEGCGSPVPPSSAPGLYLFDLTDWGEHGGNWSGPGSITQDWSDFSDFWHDNVESIKVAGNYSYVLYEDEEFGGTHLYGNGSRDLGLNVWRDRADSMHVRNGDPSTAAFILYERGDYGGEAWASDRTIDDLCHWSNSSNCSSAPPNDWAESIKVAQGFGILACEHSRFHGICGRATGPVQFSDINALAPGLRHSVSSVMVCGGSCPPPATGPTLIYPAADGHIYAGQRIVLQWGSGGYEFQGELWGGAIGNVPLQWGWTRDTQYDAGQLAASSTPYYWHVRASNGFGDSGWVSGSFYVDNPPTCYDFATMADPTGSGWIYLDPLSNCGNPGRYIAGTVITLTALTNGNSTFLSWIGDVTGIANPVSLAMTGNKSVTANFDAGIIGTDRRVRIDDTTEVQARAVADLDVTFPSGYYPCTGFFIDPHTVVTAGHCVYNPSWGGWATTIHVMPARSGSSIPFGFQSVGIEALRASTRWVTSSDPQYDYGAIILPDDTLGTAIGEAAWFKLAALNDSQLDGVWLFSSGYASDKYNPACTYPAGCEQWAEVQRAAGVTPHILNYGLDTSRGQAGSPVRDIDLKYVLAIQSGDWNPPTPCVSGLNCGVRITREVAQELLTWSGHTTPTSTLVMGSLLKNRVVTIDLRDAELHTGSVFKESALTDGSGNVTFTLTGVAPGTYNMFVKPHAYLRKLVANFNLLGGANNLDTNYLCPVDGWGSCGGDINDNNRVEIFDYNWFIYDFMSTDPIALARSDLNSDGKVNVFDYSYLVAGYGKEGDGGSMESQSVVALKAADSEGELWLTADTNSTSLPSDATQTSTQNVGDVVTLTLGFNTSGLPMAGANVLIDYDHCVLDVLQDQIVNSGVFSTTSVVSRTDSLQYQAHKWAGVSSAQGVSGTGLLAQIPFRVLTGSMSPTRVSIRFSPGDTFESNMDEDGTIQAFLGSVTNTVLYPIGMPQRPTRIVQIISPSSGEIVNDDLVNLEAQTSDPCNGIRKVTFYVFTPEPQGLGIVRTLAGSAGSFGSADGIGGNARFNAPFDVALSNVGDFALVADSFNNTIRRIDMTTGAVTTLAGAAGISGSADGIGSAARFNSPYGVTLSSDGRIALVTDWGNHTIRRIELNTGAVSTIAGSVGNSGSTDGVGSIARFHFPAGIVLSTDGVFALIADNGNSTIRRIELATGAVTTLAGSADNPGSADGIGFAARFSSPSGIGLSADGTVALVADTSNHTIRRIDVVTTQVTTLAGSAGNRGSDDGVGSAARFFAPYGITLSKDARFALVSDGGNNTIRRVEVETREVTTTAGSAGYQGSDDGVGGNARFLTPSGVSLNADGTYALIADAGNSTVRRMDLGQWSPVGTDTNGSDGWSVSWNAGEVPDQIIKVKAFASDLAGNGVESSTNEQILLDRERPAVTNLVLYPPSALPGQPVTITVTITDAKSGVKRTDVYVTPYTGSSGFSVPLQQVGTISGTTGSVVWNTHANAPGLYQVVLRLEDNGGNQGFWPMPGRILVLYHLQHSSIYIPLVMRGFSTQTVHASFVAVPTSGQPPLSVQFIDQSSGPITSWLWSFGDGAPASSERNPVHTYTSAGAYTVILRVSGLYGSDTLTRTEYIDIKPPQVASFEAGPVTGNRPLPVAFFDTSSGAVGSWVWTFGDGGSSTQWNPIHTYTSQGSFTVTLTVAGPYGSNTLIRTNYITVTDDPATLYVGPNGIDADNNCLYSTTPCATVQRAVDVASPGDEIRVAAGTYSQLSVRPRNDITTTGQVTQVVYLNKSITIRGGYTETNWIISNPGSNPTTLDAQGQGRVIYATGNISTTIEDLRFTRGNANGLGGLTGVPGVDDAGGGAYIVSATVTFSNNQIFDNSVPSLDGSGGGLYSYRSSVTLANNIVISNSAHFSGGGLFLDDSASTLVRNTVASNTAGLGGGLVIQGQQSATITGNTVVSNTSDYGGGLFLEGGAPILDGNIIFSNTAQHGGGLFLENTHAVIKNTVIADNRASGAGSGLSSYFSYPRLIHTTFAHNSGSTSAVNASFQSTVNMTNTILVSHTIGVYASLGSTITLESTLWGSGVWANELDWSGGGTIMTGTHNYWGDPAFVNPNIGDYHIGTTSAAVDNGIDAGVAIDIDGEIRPFGTASDIGADEYVAALSVKAFTLSRSSMHSDHYQSTLLSPLRVLRFQQFQTWLNGG